MMQPLWVRALSNRTYWDNYRLAHDAFLLKAQVEARLEHLHARKKRWRVENPEAYKSSTSRSKAKRRRELREARKPYVTPKPLPDEPTSPCPDCGAPRVLRAGSRQPIHMANVCHIKLWKAKGRPRIDIPRCSDCTKPAVADGRCALHASRARRSSG